MAKVHAFVLGLLGTFFSLGGVTANVSMEGEVVAGPAAQLGVQPSPILTADQTATIAYQCQGRANQIVTVDIDDGSLTNPRRTTVEIALDANGYGKVEWRVPDWGGARFSAPDAPTESRIIVPLM